MIFYLAMIHNPTKRWINIWIGLKKYPLFKNTESDWSDFDYMDNLVLLRENYKDLKNPSKFGKISQILNNILLPRQYKEKIRGISPQIFMMEKEEDPEFHEQ